jgi:class 3 adenylate cyclase/tetratricopeptide (TPR) repeat protein
LPAQLEPASGEIRVSLSFSEHAFSLDLVAICSNCGRESEGDFAFCPYCAAPLTAASTAREQRKTVTVLFCDVTGSTELGESTDPEALRALLARYFERMKGIVEAHGGTVEKFIGDAVMAVFGVPQVHEDDALRACRAALEMRDALPVLGVQARIGVNTGEVVTGTEERLATGDAVNVAARLEHAAQPGEILIGQDTLRLVRRAVEAESVEPLDLKGKTKPVTAYRLLTAHDVPERRLEAPMVGRAREFDRLRDAFDQAVQDRTCQLFTVLGAAGVGKSRLAAEFVNNLEARVVRGRCLSYGEGITYWPVVEVLRQLDSLPTDPAAAAALRSLLGESEQATSADEIAWAFRKLLEERAQEHALVCLFDDVHWGEETFLDLVEHVALLASGAPILLLCLARPELRERRAAWRVTLRLEPLSEADVDRLIPQTIGAELRAKIGRAAGGNPLFVTEMVAMNEETEGEVVVPPTLQALLAARLDLLEAGERRVLECAAVEGEVFHLGAVQALSEDGQVTPHLASLVRKELIGREKPLFPAEDAFRFRHLLIRDAAYRALPKAARAQLHQRFVAWLEEHGDQLVELDEVLGHHLEQAARYRNELGQPDLELASRAGARLASAGRRALWRGDKRAAGSLLERALALTRPLRLDVALELDLAHSLDRDPRKAADVVEEAAERSRTAGDHTGEALARTVVAFHRVWFTSDPDIGELEKLAREALPLAERRGDHAALVHIWHAVGYGVANFRGRWDEWTHAAERALFHARAAGQQTAELFGIELALASGTLPADDALRKLDAALPEYPWPGSELVRAWLLAMLGRFDEATPIVEQARARMWELAGAHWADWIPAEIAALAGDHETAVQYLGPFCDFLEERDQRFYLSSVATTLGRELCLLGRYDEGARYAALARRLVVPQNALGEAAWRQVHALVHSSRGDHAEAAELAGKAVAIVEQTDGLNYQGDALCDLAAVLAAAGRVDEAADALAQALERYERKKNLAMVAQMRPRLDELRAGVPQPR